MLCMHVIHACDSCDAFDACDPCDACDVVIDPAYYALDLQRAIFCYFNCE